MSSKSLDHKDPGRVQGATVLGPGDFPIGSMQSRAAARLRLQKIGEVGKGSAECICFPEDEQPFFRTAEESDLAEGVQCPLHGKRFTPRFHIYVAAWRWENEVKFRWPRLSTQYHKAWAARLWEYTAAGLVINVDSSLNGKTLIVRVAFRIPTSSWDGNPLSAIPFGMQFERQLGSGSEYVNHPEQQQTYPDCSGVASDRLDLAALQVTMCLSSSLASVMRTQGARLVTA